jgi:hypothetical protein
LQFDEDRVGLLQAEIAGLKQGIANNERQVEAATKWEAAFKSLREMVRRSPELNMKNYTEDEVAQLNHDVILMEVFCQEVERS